MSTASRAALTLPLHPLQQGKSKLKPVCCLWYQTLQVSFYHSTSTASYDSKRVVLSFMQGSGWKHTGRVHTDRPSYLEGTEQTELFLWLPGGFSFGVRFALWRLPGRAGQWCFRWYRTLAAWRAESERLPVTAGSRPVWRVDLWGGFYTCVCVCVCVSPVCIYTSLSGERLPSRVKLTSTVTSFNTAARKQRVKPVTCFKWNLVLWYSGSVMTFCMRWYHLITWTQGHHFSLDHNEVD